MFVCAGAFAAANQGRKLDLADRYLNCIAVKACFRAGRIEEADELAALFTKDEEQIINLVEMQCLWYEIACGEAHCRKQNYGKVRSLSRLGSSVRCRVSLGRH